MECCSQPLIGTNADVSARPKLTTSSDPFCKSRAGSGQRIGLSQVTYPASWTSCHSTVAPFTALNARLCKRGCGHELLSCHAVST